MSDPHPDFPVRDWLVTLQMAEYSPEGRYLSENGPIRRVTVRAAYPWDAVQSAMQGGYVPWRIIVDAVPDARH